MASTYLTMTPTATDQGAAWTFSTWLKRGSITAVQCIFSAGTVSSHRFQLNFQSDDTIGIFIDMVGVSSSDRKTTTKYRDPGAWYHILMNWNGTTTTLYVNGVETSMSASTTGDSSSKIVAGTNIQHKIGAHFDASDKFDGEMAHTHFSSSTSYAPTVFGETDATSGIWVAKTSPSVTYGDNGFFLKYQDTSNFGDDSSGETNDFAVAGGTMTQTKDTPDNNFCTLNPLANFNSGGTYSNGNTKWVTATDGSTRYNISSVGLVAGKWYCEVKMKQSNTSMIGITDKEQPDSSEAMTQTNYGAAYKSNDGKYIVNGGSATTYGDSYTTDDIVGIYLDLDNNKLYFGKNGTVQNSGTGITITGISAMTAPTASSQYCYFMGGTKDNGGSTFEFNFGNGYFGTDAVTSGVADAGGEGTFEYDPSSGTFDGSSKDFRAICTNNIATYGG